LTRSTQAREKIAIHVGRAALAFTDIIRSRCSRKLTATPQPPCWQFVSTSFFQNDTMSRWILNHLRRAVTGIVIFLAEHHFIHDRKSTSTLVGIPHPKHRLASRRARVSVWLATFFLAYTVGVSIGAAFALNAIGICLALGSIMPTVHIFGYAYAFIWNAICIFIFTVCVACTPFNTFRARAGKWIT
jgi:hypothetical protein